MLKKMFLQNEKAYYFCENVIHEKLKEKAYFLGLGEKNNILEIKTKRWFWYEKGKVTFCLDLDTPIV